MEMKLANCIGIITESQETYAPLNTPCEITYDKESGLIKSAHGLDNKGGTYFNNFYAYRTKWQKIEDYNDPTRI